MKSYLVIVTQEVFVTQLKEKPFASDHIRDRKYNLLVTAPGWSYF